MVSRRHRREELERDHSSITSGPDPLLRAFTSPALPSPRLSPLDNMLHQTTVDAFVRSLDDRRQFSPWGDFRPVASPALPSRNVVVNRMSRMRFAQPPMVTVCVRRKERREVMFAKNKAGGGSRRRKRFNYWSNVKC